LLDGQWSSTKLFQPHCKPISGVRGKCNSGTTPEMASIVPLHSSISDHSEYQTELEFAVTLRSCDRSVVTSAGKILRVDQGFFQISSPLCLDPYSKVDVTIDDCTVKTEVVSCDKQDDGDFRVSLRRIYGPQRAIRAEPRIPVDFTAVLVTSSGDRIFARVVDMSQSGLGLELSAAVAAGTRASVSFVAGVAFGEVRHCTQAAFPYRAGIRIHEFMVRHSPTTGGLEPADSKRSVRAAPRRIWNRVTTLALRLCCLLAGHEYGWSVDSWERAVLRCKRCKGTLDGSTQRG
jgi:hypothetical protein